MKNLQYDPMLDFWKRFWPFLFQQTPALVFMAGVWWIQRNDIEHMEARHEKDRLEIRKECAQAIDELRQDLKLCQNENDTLRRENIGLHRRMSLLETRLKR